MTPDVVIVGGGVMGSSTAYHLLCFDPSLSVLVMERDPSYRHASTVLSDGNVRIQFNLEENIRISQHTMEVLETFSDDMATASFRPEVAARHQGNLFFVDDAGLEEARRGLELQRSLGCDVEWLDADEVARRFPAAAAEEMVGATLGPRDGSVDPTAVLMGYRRKAIELGARFVAAEVDALLTTGGAATGVRTVDGDETHAASVVLTGGAWTARLAETAGVRLPVEPVMRTVYVVSSTVPAEGLPSLFLPSGVYAIPESDHTWLMAWSQPDDPVGFDFTPASRERFEDLVWPGLVAHLPAFDQLRVERSWAGLYAVNTLDGNAILGEWPEMARLFVATGFSGHGFQQAPAVGRYTAEAVLGRPHALDLSRFGGRRVLDGQPLREHAARII